VSANLTQGVHTLKVWFDQATGSRQFLNLDNLRVSQGVVIAANSAARNAPTESRWAGAASAPYVCCWGTQGQYVTFAFSSTGGPTSLALRYSAGNGNAQRKLELDGAVMVANQNFAATSGWNSWSLVTVDANLTAGAHTLKIWFDQNAGSNQYINLDSLWVSTG
jgi:hypothetical protein